MLVQALTIVQIAAAAVFVASEILLWRARARAATPVEASGPSRGDVRAADLVAAAASAVAVLGAGLGRLALADDSTRGVAWSVSSLPAEAAWAVTLALWLAVAASGLLTALALRGRTARLDRPPASGGEAGRRVPPWAPAALGVGVVTGLLALAEAVAFAVEWSGSSLSGAADVLTHELGKSAAGIFPVVLFPFVLLTLLLVLALVLRSSAPSDGGEPRFKALPLGLLAAVAVLVVLTDLVVAYLLTRGALDLTAGGGAEITIWIAYLLVSLGLLGLLLFWAVRRRPGRPVALPADAGDAAEGEGRQDAPRGTLVVDAAGARPPARRPRSLVATSPLLTIAGVLALLAVVALLVAPLLPYWQGVAVAWAGVACGLACLPVGAVVFYREVLKG